MMNMDIHIVSVHDFFMIFHDFFMIFVTKLLWVQAPPSFPSLAVHVHLYSLVPRPRPLTRVLHGQATKNIGQQKIIKNGSVRKILESY